MNQPFTLGVNYWPRRKAMYWWSNFEADEVREEFGIIHDLGMRLVRIFLLWDDFQPAPNAVSAERMDDLRTVCDIAADLGLQLDVTFFTGHMSGPNWSPRWLLAGPPLPHVRQLVSEGRVVDSGYRNPYTDQQALEAERLLISTVVGELRDHPAIGVWNLGNEPDLFAEPPDAEAGRAWVREMTTLIRGLDSQHPVTCGLHVASLLRDNGLRVDQVFGETDFAVMHAYPMYLNWARNPLDPDLVPFTCALTTALSGKPTLMEEWGGCTAAPGQPSYVWEWTAYGQPRTQFMASEEDLAEYIRLVLPKLVEVGATGAMMWCFADYIEELWDKPPCSESKHECFFGLVRPDGSLKPHAEVIRAFAATQPTVRPATRTVTLPMSPGEFYRAPAEHTVQLYQQFLGNEQR
ncbi:MAG TPA: glycoside hydrolase family 2 TIM barrel-domain containing protein [Roseiflexaceae bacterium]|nr:glycoside hydrolase family 2 TIM barrel-domain containing protein [Roseiflexaceae bacterium]